MTTTAQDVSTIPPLGRDEAMALAATAYQRFADAIDALAPGDWDRPTDNEEWVVRALVAHVLGMMEMNATVRETVRQQLAATRASKRSGKPLIDELTALQVAKQAALSPGELAGAIRSTAPKALAARRRAPRLVRALPIPSGSPEFPEKWTMGYLLDRILTRDTWMHRIDLCRAVGAEPTLTGDHDGRIVADVVAEWARRHARPFTLVLAGPAGGAFAQGGGGAPMELDAVEFCRILSGRADGTGLLATRVPF
ncbi:MAG TPA: maleylpyruvate isomerase family mycothiol-dependent enzyme [Acidimicrobiales bacterium]|nr:maleylpyruvate isomerase family mycothiol-dependent enzyme [Acidimicrobiales bacterium]